MALHPTTRLAARYPDLAQAADLAFLLQTLAQDLDLITVGYKEGLLSAKPAAGLHGFVYLATDKLNLYYDDGTVWWLIPLPLSVKARLSADQVKLPAAWSLVTWAGTEDYDSDTLHDVGINPQRITIQHDGMYRIAASLRIDFSGTPVAGTSVTAVLQKNSDSLPTTDDKILAVKTWPWVPTPIDVCVDLYAEENFVATDFVSITFHNDTGVNCTIKQFEGTWFSASRF